MEKLKVNLNPYYVHFCIRGQVFKLHYDVKIPPDIMVYSDFVFDSDGTVLKHRYPVGSAKFNHVVHTIRTQEGILEYKFNPDNKQEIDLFIQRIHQQYVAFMQYRDLT